MHVNGHPETTLKHLSFGSMRLKVKVERARLRCPVCGHSNIQQLPFKAQGHDITEPLETYVRELLSTGMYTLKSISYITGVGINVVKAIDKKQLEEKYTVPNSEGGLALKSPKDYSEILGIDEFKLHDDHKYATHIIDIKTGHVLWVARGKKKQVVYDFIDHVGDDWMKHVKAVSHGHEF